MAGGGVVVGTGEGVVVEARNIRIVLIVSMYKDLQRKRIFF